MLAAWRFPITVALLATTVLAAKWSERSRPEPLIQPLQTVATRIADWTMTEDIVLSDEVLAQLRPTAYLNREYRKGNYSLALFIGYYDQQRAGGSMHSPRNCLPGAGWEIWRRESVNVPFQDRPVKINQFSIQNGGQRLVVLYWYQSRRRVVASEYLGKLLLARDAVFQGQTGGSLARVSVPDTPEAIGEGLRFAGGVMTELQRCLTK